MEIVSIATHLPYEGIPHAGGELYRRHAELLAQLHQVSVVCPWTPANERAMSLPAPGSYRRILLDPGGRRPTRRRGRSLMSRALPFLATGSFLRALLDHEVTAEAIQRADRIELQWFDAIALAPRLRRRFPGTPLVGVFHDVVSQGHRRRLLGPAVPLPHRILALARLVFSVPVERWAVRALRTVVVFSDKDKALIARRRAGDRVLVLAPPLDDPEMPTAPRHEAPPEPEVLFVGALWRSENEDAALWLLREIWPRVRAKLPEARLVLAGADPTLPVRREVDATEGVTLTGHVDSLTEYYRRASVAVAPMRFGAGVKLKAVVAMMWGVPVIATPVGAEGVEGPEVFLAVEDDAAAFATAVAGALTDPGPALEVAARAHGWSHGRFSAASYRHGLSRLYG